MEAAASLAAFLILRPVTKNKPIPRPHPLSRDKLTIEGGLVKAQNLLGCDISARLHSISPPTHKQLSYYNCVLHLLDAPTVNPVELENLLGRLNNSSNVIPLARHFTARICVALTRAHLGPTIFMAEEAANMNLWIFFLCKAAAGISLNLIVEYAPDLIVWSDSCPSSLGGATSLGLLWCYSIPPEYWGKLSNNDLKLVVNCITVEMALSHHADVLPSHACLLALFDSNSAIG